MKVKSILKIAFINILLPFVLAYNAYNLFFISNENQSSGKAQVKSSFVESDEEILFLKQNASLNAGYTDYRALVLDKYFEKYNSPLFGYGKYFVAACDKYGTPYDCTFLSAIAYVETKLCTKALSAVQYNCWGWGGSGSNRIIFKNFPEAIDRITRGMASGYGIANLNNPYRLVGTYCGPNCNPYWASSVEREQKAIDKIARDLGLPPLFN